MQQRNSFNGIASTVSLGAAAFAVGMPASQAVAQEPYVVTADGGVTFSDFSDAIFEEKGGAPSFDTDVGFFGSVAVSKMISDTWDWRVSGTLLSYGNNEVTASAPGVSVGLSQSMTGILADADLGWHKMMGETDLRLGIGLQAASYDKGIDFDATDGVDRVRGKYGVEYSGIGPKFSADVTHPVSADGRMKLIAGASLAPTTGDIDVSVDASNGMGMSERDGQSVNADALVSSAYLGLSMQRSDTSDWRMGLRIDNIDTDVEGAGSEGVGLINDSVMSTSLFVGLRIEF
ncbi:MAG: hypothetical protein NTW20_02115 [Rhodobacterales bacterium]|nr:hypothetical protein [Rhodobacterales bacterium]